MKKLNPELAAHLEEFNRFKGIRHPLVYCVPFGETDFEIEHANKAIMFKKRATRKALENNDILRFIFLHERPHRLHALQDFILKSKKRVMHHVYWRALGEVFTDSENIWQNFDDWKDALEFDKKARKSIMNAEEQFSFKKLPKVLTVYRGLQKEEQRKDGLSFTLSEEKAQWFSKRYNGQGIVVKGTVKKSDVIAYFNRRNEEEIVVLPGKVKFEGGAV